jgi:hypothetical protein
VVVVVELVVVVLLVVVGAVVVVVVVGVPCEQAVEPESVNDWPAAGTKFQS